MPVCSHHGCPTIVTKSGYCPNHRRARNQARGSSTARGYDTDHQRLRRAWTPTVRAGTVTCPKCGKPIAPSELWDLGHTDDRTAYTGPEHATCNRIEAGRKAHRAGPPPA